MDKDKFPELEQTSDLELLRTRQELAELKTKAEKYEQILKENDLLDAVPVTSDAELICVSQLAKYQKATASGGVLTLEEVKIVDLLVKNLLLARGRTVPEESKKGKGKNHKNSADELGKLLEIAAKKIND